MMSPRYPRDQRLFPQFVSTARNEAGGLRARRPPSDSLAHHLTRSSVHPGLDDLGERVSRAVQSRLHRAEVAVRDLGDLFV